jgi:arylsulfatase
MTGHSWLKHFANPSAPKDTIWTIYPADKPIGWELHAQAALRKGAWKIVHLRAKYGGAAQKEDDPQGWELFNVEADPGETVNLAAEEPEKMAELLKDWDDYVVEMGLIWGENGGDNRHTKEEAPELWDNDFELQKTWMDVKGGQVPEQVPWCKA